MTSQLLLFFIFITPYDLEPKNEGQENSISQFLLLLFIFITPDDLEPENEGQENSMTSHFLYFFKIFFVCAFPPFPSPTFF
jgi:hypothetical protein